MKALRLMAFFAMSLPLIAIYVPCYLFALVYTAGYAGFAAGLDATGDIAAFALRLAGKD